MIPRWSLLTLHPEMVRPFVEGSILGRAVEAGLVAIDVRDVRDHAEGKHKVADDTPYGGGAGMVMKVDVVARAIDAVRTEGSWVVLTSPGGRPLTQAVARELSGKPHVVLVCGHYEGIDARIETLVDDEISLGDFVLTGGEIAAAAIVDAAVRLIPGVLGNDESAGDESFGAGLLEYPHYTRPRTWNGIEVPEVLLSGHHGRIDAWRRARAEERTKARRPDLWAAWLAAGGRPIDETGGDE